MAQTGTNPLNLNELASPPVAEVDRIPLRRELAKAAEPIKRPVEPTKPTNRLTADAPAVAKPTIATKDDIENVRFPSRSLAPEAIILGSVSTIWLLGIMPFIPTSFQSLELTAAVPGTCALYLLVKWLFGIMGGAYTLTKTQINRVIPGPIPDPPAIEISKIATVTVEQSWMEWLLLVGRLVIAFERDSQPPETLGPVGWPKRRKQVIDNAVRAAREGTAFAGRAA